MQRPVWHNITTLIVASGLLKHFPVSPIQNPANKQKNIIIHLDVDNK